MGRVILLAIFLVLGLTACKRTPYSSPTALRDTNAYAKAMSPPPPDVLDLTRLEQFTVALDGESLVITSPANSSSGPVSDGARHVVTRLAPGQKIDGDGATFEVVAISVSGPGISKPPADGKKTVPLDFFAPDGHPLSTEELKALGMRNWQLTEYVGNEYYSVGDFFPQVKVWFGSRRLPPRYVTPLGVFDATTKYNLASGYSYSQVSTDSYGFAEFRPRAWHSTPMEVVVDVELDGRSMVETNAAPGTTVEVAGGLVRFLGVWDGNSSSWSSSSSSGAQTTRVSLRETENQTNAVALFATEPPRLAVHFEVLDALGKKLEDGGGTSGGVRLVGLKGRAADVKAVRFTVYTNHYWVVMTLPPLPNLPMAAGSVANLFEVPIPRVQIRREDELRDVVGSLTQMRFVYPPFGDTMPTNVFPMMLTNVTSAELLTLYQSHLTRNFIIVVDDAKQEIRVEPTQLEKIRRWVKQKLRL